MRKSWAITLFTLVAGLALGWWGLFDLGLLPALRLGRPQSASAAIIPDTATTYSHGQLLYAGREGYDLSHARDYFEQPTYIPRPLTYVRLAFIASVVEKPYTVFYFTGAPIPVSAFGFETNIAVKPATLNHLFNAAGSLPCAPNSNDLKIRGGDVFDVRRRGPDGIVRRCIIPKTLGCAFLRQTANYLHVMDSRQENAFLSIADTQRRVDCKRRLF